MGHLRLKLVGRMNETQILQMQCRNICKLNSSRKAGKQPALDRIGGRIPTPWLGRAIITGINLKANFGNISQQASRYYTLRFAG